MKNIEKIAKEIFNRQKVYKAINKEVGPSSSKRLTDEIMKLKKVNKKSVEKIISLEWGPNITKSITKNLGL